MKPATEKPDNSPPTYLRDRKPDAVRPPPPPPREDRNDTKGETDCPDAGLYALYLG